MRKTKATFVFFPRWCVEARLSVNSQARCTQHHLIWVCVLRVLFGCVMGFGSCPYDFGLWGGGRGGEREGGGISVFFFFFPRNLFYSIGFSFFTIFSFVVCEIVYTCATNGGNPKFPRCRVLFCAAASRVCLVGREGEDLLSKVCSCF